MPPTESTTQAPSPAPSKTHRYLLVLLLLVLFGLLAACLWFAYTKQKEVNSLKNQLNSANSQLSEQKQQSKDLAFAVYPEQAYADFRKKAYIELYKQTFPQENFKDQDITLLRVFNTSSFVNSDPYFKGIQNDDIVVYSSKDPNSMGKINVITVRPREQRVIAHDQILPLSIAKARQNNVTESILGKGVSNQNFLSQQ